MLPTTTVRSRRSAASQRLHFGGWSTYVRRLSKPKQMDLEYTFWLMLQLCTSPKTAYRHTSYHKDTKNQWSRDDPAFLVITSAFVAISSIAYCVVFGNGFASSVGTTLYAVVVDFLLVGAVIATLGWGVSNKFLRRKNLPSHTVEQHVEWMYAFDVQCNSFFPMFLLLHVGQFVLSPLLLSKGFLGLVLANALYVIALGYYHYLNFLGYSALPFLERTEVFLYPIGLLLMSLPFVILSQFNPTIFVLGLYFG